MSLKSHAEIELELLERNVPDAIITPFKKEIIALCEAVGKSGQSGGSMPFTASALSQAIKKLLQYETIVPLTGEDWEWMEISDINEGATDIMKYQNMRDTRVFKQENGEAYFIDAIVFDGDKGGTFTTGSGIKLKDGSDISSRLFIKSFPFTPKTFYVDVIDYRWLDKEEKVLDDNGDWWTHEIKDETQLEEVFKYYKR